jgi:hypothetical protein
VVSEEEEKSPQEVDAKPKEEVGSVGTVTTQDVEGVLTVDN